MDSKNHTSDRARAYPTGDAQGQHPAPVGNGQGLSHRNGRVRRKKRARSVRELRLRCARNRNADGEALLQAACAFDLAITNTWFKKKEEHLITYKSVHHATQIDYFLVRRRSLCCVKNCKVLPGESLVAQNRLVVMEVKLSVSPRNSQTQPPPKTRWRMLENDECASRFRNHIVEKMIEMNEMEEKLVDECWNEMARHIRKVAKDVFGESKGKGRWNEEVQNVLREKKVAFKVWQVVKNVNTSLKDEIKEVYKEFKRRAKKAVAVARAKAQEKLYNSLNSPRGQKELYRITKERERRSRYITHIKCMKDEADDIPFEVWKVLKTNGCMWLTLFFNKLLPEETIPQEWCCSSLVLIFKNKGDVQDWNNYRGIKLMSHTMKVWEKVIERRLREESEITQNQLEFMSGRGTMDELCEKYRRAHKNLHMVFIDLEKAYDRVPREVLWWALKGKGLPGKYVELVRAMYRGSCTYVRSSAGNTDQFSMAVGLHQGSALSPYPFLLIMDALTADIQEKAPWCMLFANDIVLVSEDGPEIQSRLEDWQQKLENRSRNTNQKVRETQKYYGHFANLTMC
ncbi:uncharacterized protein LOC113395141 [Vanessa tameamea]|uniref:Uncharacterized protein LOC113395141 n=1 Tax=Vanessa tameamea TaxID=334116 RepID=A0A8B8HUF0_VANTA